MSKKYFVTCITTKTSIGVFDNKEEADNAIINHCYEDEERKHDFKIIVRREHTHSNNRFRIISLDNSYKSNWIYNESDSIERLLNYQKRNPLVSSFIIEETTMLYESINNLQLLDT